MLWPPSLSRRPTRDSTQPPEPWPRRLPVRVGFAEALRNAPVRAAGKSQGRQRPHRDNHATDDLHGLSLLDCTCTPRLGDASQLSGDPH